MRSLAGRVGKLERERDEREGGGRLWLVIGGEEPTEGEKAVAIAKACAEGCSTKIMIWGDDSAI